MRRNPWTRVHHEMAEAMTISPAAVRALVFGSESRAQCVERWAALKAGAHARYRRLCLDLHPDRTGGDEAKAAQLRAAIQVWSEFKALDPATTWENAHARPAPRPFQVRIVVHTGSTVSTNTYSSWPGPSGWTGC